MFQSLLDQRFEPQLAQSWHLGTQGAIGEARAMALATLARAREAQDETLEACAGIQIAWFCFQTGDSEAGLEHAAAGKRIFQALGLRRGEAAAGALTAWLLLEVGLGAEASVEVLGALDTLDGTDDPAIMGFAVNVLGCVFWTSQQLEQALPLCQDATDLAGRSGDPVTLAWWRVNLAGVHAGVGYRALELGRRDEAEAAFATALAIYRAALEMAQASGDRWCQYLTLCNAAQYLCATGQVDDAIAHLDRCDALPRFEARRSRTQFLFTKAEVLLYAGRAAEAMPSCREALRLAGASGDAEATMLSLKHLSAIHERLGAVQEALDCFRQFFAAHQKLAAEKTQRLARIASIRYETHRLRQQAEAAEAQVASLVQTAQSDALTGLPNRRAFDRAIAGLAGQQRPYALAVVDLDHFKRINDRFSHMVGDEVLKQVGTVLADCCRPGDLAARLGGEEFALVFDDVTGSAAASLCETVRQALASVPWERHHRDLRVTASIGVAFGAEATTAAAVLALADQRLYRAKKQGRNRVVADVPPRIAAARGRVRARVAG